ncbi:MAG: hypothetical protein ACXADC_08755 [Candidatus Thorarchaeota archaeon]
MSKEIEGVKFLRAIRKVLSDVHSHFIDAMDILDEIGEASVGTGMTPLMGGYAMKDPKESYRTARVMLEAAEKSLDPLAKRIRDGRVNQSHFKDPKALTLLKDLMDYDYQILMDLLSEGRGRESVWYRLREMSEKIEDIFSLVVDE